MTLDHNAICAMNYHYFRHPLGRFLDDAQQADVRAIEIWAAAPHFQVGVSSLDNARALGKDIRARGMRISCFTPEQCVYPVNIASAEVGLRDRSIRYFLESLELSVEMGSPALLVTPGSGYADHPADEARTRCIDALGLIADRATRLGQRLYLEALPPAWTNIARTAAELADLLDTVNSPVLLGMLDTAGAMLLDENVSDYIAALGPRLAHVHMIDSDPSGAHLAWGDGQLSAKDIVTRLDDAGYAGDLSIEITNQRYYLDPQPALVRSVAALRNALGA